MTLRVADLVAEPCTERWDAMTPDGAGRRCDRCSKTVVDLDGMTEAQIAVHARPGTCVRVPIDTAGNVRVAAPHIVPLVRLRRHPAPIVAAAVAMMIACTPHVRPAETDLESRATVVDAPPTKLESTTPQRHDDRPHYALGAIRSTHRDPTKIAPTGVPCDTLPSHPLGHPARADDFARGLVATRDLADADLLAFCDP